ncbi:MAG: cobalamin-binding protein [Acidobacteria bacterium]|nr:cobalamin-binding protein [Acidobacteriota bacterium]
MVWDQFPRPLTWTLVSQEVPSEIKSSEFIYGLRAWLTARGIRTSHVNGNPESWDRRYFDRLPPTTPHRIVSICPSNTEIVASFGAAERLIALDASSDFPPSIQGLPRLGMDLDVDVEKILSLDPDLVVASLSVPGMEKNVVKLHKSGVPLVVLAPLSIDEVLQDIMYLGQVCDADAQASATCAQLHLRLERTHDVLCEEPVRLYLEWWPKPLFTPGRACWTNDLAARAGASLVFGDRAGQSVEVGSNEVIARDPELILVSWCGVPFHKLKTGKVLERDGWHGIHAVRNGHVYAVDEDLLGRPGPRLVAGCEAIHDLCNAVKATRV